MLHGEAAPLPDGQPNLTEQAGSLLISRLWGV